MHPTQQAYLSQLVTVFPKNQMKNPVSFVLFSELSASQLNIPACDNQFSQNSWAGSSDI